MYKESIDEQGSGAYDDLKMFEIDSLVELWGVTIFTYGGIGNILLIRSEL